MIVTITEVRQTRGAPQERVSKDGGGQPLSGLPEIGTISAQVGYSRLVMLRDAALARGSSA